MSVDPPDVSERLRRERELPMRFLCDERGTLMDVLHVRDRDGMPSASVAGDSLRGKTNRDVFLPTTFLLDGGGVIRWVYRPDTYRVRARPEDVLRAIDALG